MSKAGAFIKLDAEILTIRTRLMDSPNDEILKAKLARLRKQREKMLRGLEREAGNISK